MTALLGGIEAGGTKFVLGVRRGTGLIARTRVATTQPAETMAEVADFFAAIRQQHGALAAVGLATFGPVGLDQASADYGCLVDTPKPGWAGFDIRTAVSHAAGAPCTIETDVNAAALAEGREGACRGLQRHCYVTVGTGIGVGFIEDGRPARAHPHAEAGHMRVGRAAGDLYAGHCPYHRDCLEGLACGPAMAARWGVEGSRLPADHQAWDFQTHYLAALCANLTYTFRPQRIVLAGGVFNAPFLLGRVRQAFAELLNGYAPGEYAGDAATYLAAPVLDDPSPGLVGAFMLAQELVARAP